MTKNLSPNSQKVQKALKKLKLEREIIQLPQETRTALQAAKAVGCHLGQIAKSLVFKIKKTGQPILIITSGKNQVDEEKIAKKFGLTLELAKAEFVKAKTGFTIGGVPPIGHSTTIKTFLDKDLFAYQTIWAAGGHPKTIFKLTPEELKRITQGQIIKVS